MKLTAAINVAWKARGLDEDTARDVYERVTGKRRLTLMTETEQRAVLASLNSSAAPTRKRGLSGPYAAKLQALWISGWNLGVVHVRTDDAMLSFVKRQTGIEHTRFLRDAADARKAVEALKGWLERSGGVNWGEFLHPQDCVVEAQRRKLGAEAPAPIGASKTEYMNLLGERIRARAGA
jgi:hypothetical protein